MMVQIEDRNGGVTTYSFDHSFKIGRDPRCDVFVDSPYVSRSHAQITLEDGSWWISDLESTNGTYRETVRISRHAVEPGVRYYLSKRGPRLTFFESAASAESTWDSFAKVDDGPVRKAVGNDEDGKSTKVVQLVQPISAEEQSHTASVTQYFQFLKLASLKT